MKAILSILFVSVFAMSCTTIQPLTGETVKEYKIDEEVLKKVQFKLSSSITLTREYFIDTCSSKKRKLITKKTNVHEKFIIKKKTPCLVKSFSNGQIEMTFGDKDKVLTFVSFKGAEYTVKTVKDVVKYGDYYYYINGDVPMILCKRKHIFKHLYITVQSEGKKIK